MPCRPEWIKCIEKTKGVTHCGRNTACEFVFQSIDHALLHVEQRGRLLPCKACLTKAITWVNSFKNLWKDLKKGKST
jgi:hypothetical protein